MPKKPKKVSKKRPENPEKGGDSGDASSAKPVAQQIIPSPIVGEMRDSYLDYAMSVITTRALPDTRDGLKPVHRRILFSMNEIGLTSSAKFKKSANVVGDVLGKYHPHGDVAVYDAMVKMAQDFSARYPLVQGQGNMGCFTKDTQVQLTDGRSISFEKLVEEHKAGKRHWTFSFNHKKKGIEIAEIKNPRVTRKNAELVEVNLDNGKRIRCTPDHRFMLRDGSYREAQFLENHDSLMPFYVRPYEGEKNKELNGYSQVSQPFTQKWDFVHRLADAWNIQNRVYKKNAGRVRHHIDFDKYNNNPDNIRRMQWEEHWRLHADMASWRHKNDPEYVRKLAHGREKFIKENPEFLSRRASERNKKMWKDSAFREAQIARLKAMWEDTEYKEFMRKKSSESLKRLWQDPAFQELMSKYKSKEMKQRWQDEAYRKKMSSHMQKISQKIWENPEHRALISQRMKEITSDPEWKRKQSRLSKALWKDEEYRAKYPEDHFSRMAKRLWETEGAREMHRQKAKKQWQDPEFRKVATRAVSDANKRRLEQHPDYMKELAQMSAQTLKKKWKDPQYKEQVIKSKILRHVKNVKEKHGKVTSELYEQERTGNGVPRVEKALQKFEDLQEMTARAEVYNHKVISVRFLEKKEDVYDLTIDMWHNFALAAGIFVHNSVDGDSAAAMRYTEARMSRVAAEMLRDIDKDTIDWRANYDGTRKEPAYLPAGVPNLLLNGTLGIAVGMATSIPPHNLRELLEASVHLIDKPKASTDDLLEYVKGPDFPTGGIIFGKNDIKHAYSTGRGGVAARGEAEIVEQKSGQFQIVISSIPYRVNKADMIVKIADLVRAKKLEGVKGIRDESARGEMRIAIDLKGSAQPQQVLNYIYKHTDLETTFHFNMLALSDGVPQTFSLKGLLEEFVAHRKSVVTRRTKFELEKAKDRAHILEGLKKALDHIDKVIKTIKKSKDTPTAHKNLMKEFKFSDAQTKAILEMKLQKLAGLERKQVEDELKEKKKLIAYLQGLLKDAKKIMGVVKAELLEVKEKYGDDRKTKVVASQAKTIAPEDLVEEKESMLVLTKGGYVKRTDPSEYRKQKRGGKGVIDLDTKDEDFVTLFLTASTHTNLLFFSDRGKVYQMKMYEIPEGKRATKGKSIVNFLPLASDEYITSVRAMPESVKEDKDWSLCMVTRKGAAKKVAAGQFRDVRRSGIIAIKLTKGDELFSAHYVQKKDEVFLASRDGQAIRFKENDIREMGRTAGGVRAMKLSGSDEIVGAGVVKKGKNTDVSMLVMSENGYGKRTKASEYKVQGRGGSGIKTMKLTQKTGKLVSAKVVLPEEDEIVAISKKGQVIRTDISAVTMLGRQTQGVRIMKLKAGDSIASLVAF